MATIIAAWAVGPAGNAGVGLDFAMADLVIAHFNEFIAAASIASDDLDADLTVDTANELAPYGPNGVYPTVDGWIALSVDGDEQSAQCARVLGSDATDEVQIANATRTRVAAELAAELRASGVPAEKVAEPADLLESAQLASRAASSRRSSTASGASGGSSAFRGDSSGVRRSRSVRRRASGRSTNRARIDPHTAQRTDVDCLDGLPRQLLRRARQLGIGPLLATA